MATEQHRLREFTSIGRALDPGPPANRVVLGLLVLAAVVSGAFAASGGAGPAGVFVRAGGGALAAFGSWAVAREIAPGGGVAGSFLALGLGLALFVLLEPPLVPVFAALFFARMAGRSTGLPATTFDSFLVAVLALLVAWRTGNPWPAAAGAAAFGLDAVLAPARARQWLFAGLCGAGAVALASTGLTPRFVPVQPDLVPRTIATLVTVGTLAMMAGTRTPDTVAALTGETLSVGRVRAAQGIVLLTAFALAAGGPPGVEAGALVWASLAAAPIGAGLRGVARSVARRAP